MVEQAIAEFIKELLVFESNMCAEWISFDNNIVFDKERNKGEQPSDFKINQYDKMVIFDIFNDISERVALIVLMETDGNVTCTMLFCGAW